MSAAEDSPLDLTGLDFGPAWAKKDTPARDYTKEVGPRDRREKGPRRNSEGRQGDRRNNDRRGKGREQGRRDDRGDRRNNDRRNNDRRGGDRRNQHREPRVETPAPDGFVGGVMPVEEGLDNLSKEIQGGGRTYSVFDLARVVIGARERFNVTFDAPKGSKFFRCKSDGSLWLTKEEATRHFWQANLLNELYEEVESEVEAPKGNFTSVAKCGLSGKWLAPPNYHSYPTAVAQMHAERFAHMSLEDYKRKIRVENGEEVVQAWIETQTKKVQFRPLSTQEILDLRKARKEAEEAAKTAQKKEAATPEPAPAEADNSSKTDETTEKPEPTEAPSEATETAQENTETPTSDAEAPAPSEAEEPPAVNKEEVEEQPTDTEPDSTTEATEKEATSPAAELFETRRDVERHFAEHHFKHIFAQVERAWVPGNVSAKLLSPGLLTLLKATVADERRYPSKLTPILCRQLSGRHLAVFKWKKKLKAGPARPHAVPDDIDLAERPKQMLAWINEHSGKTLEELWKANLPENSNKETKQNFYRDFHWLLNQGFVLLMADSTIHLAKAKATEPTPKKKKQPSEATPSNKSKGEEAANTEKTKAEAPKVESATTEPVKEEPSKEEPIVNSEVPSAETPKKASEEAPQAGDNESGKE